MQNMIKNNLDLWLYSDFSYNFVCIQRKKFLLLASTSLDIFTL